jgi:hypothetical protein
MGIWAVIGLVASIVGLGANILNKQDETKKQNELITKKIAEIAEKGD